MTFDFMCCLLIFIFVLFFFFFFSSRRRHTRCLSDWSSDVCSSDLLSKRRVAEAGMSLVLLTTVLSVVHQQVRAAAPVGELLQRPVLVLGKHRDRSEERRVGKECRSRWSQED